MAAHVPKPTPKIVNHSNMTVLSSIAAVQPPINLHVLASEKLNMQAFLFYVDSILPATPTAMGTLSATVAAGQTSGQLTKA